METKPHIGKIIKSFVDKSGMTKAIFAEKIGYTPNGIYKIFENENINTETLYKISEVLNLPVVSFFNVTYNNKEITNVISEPNNLYNKGNSNINLHGVNNGKIEIKQHEIDLLHAENEALKKEIEYLKKIVELTEKAK